MLKHIKDIRSPIVVAQQKHAARKASSIMSGGNEQPSGSANTNASSSTANAGHTKASSRTITRPPKLEVSDLSASAPLSSSGVSGLSPQPKWPEPGVASPLVELHRRVGDVADDSLLVPPTSAGTLAPHGAVLSAAGRLRQTTSESPPSTGSGREIPPSTSVSYAVAIYPYMAEQEDEFDVVV